MQIKSLNEEIEQEYPKLGHLNHNPRTAVIRKFLQTLINTDHIDENNPGYRRVLEIIATGTSMYENIPFNRNIKVFLLVDDNKIVKINATYCTININKNDFCIEFHSEEYNSNIGRDYTIRLDLNSVNEPVKFASNNNMIKFSFRNNENTYIVIDFR